MLLIIFMVTAKLIVSQSLPLDLPKAANGQDIQMIFGVELHANGDTVVAYGKKVANDDAVLRPRQGGAGQERRSCAR